METFCYGISLIGFPIISIVMYTLVLIGLRKAIALTNWDPGRRKRVFNRTLYSIIIWTLFISALSISGFLTNFSTFPPRILTVLIIPLVVILFVTFSNTLRELLPLIPVKDIIRLQTFRVFVEIILWLLVIQNLAPIQMSFEGRNLDILSGLTAPIAAYFFANNSTLLKIWNILSLGLLINILTIAVLSMPTPIRVFMNDPANTIVAEFPYVFLPGLLVPLAYGLAFFSLRQLAILKK